MADTSGVNCSIDQRREPRLAISGRAAATLSVLQGSSAGAPSPVEILNISEGGLRLRAGSPYAPGTLVRIDLNRTIILAEICYSEAEAGGFTLGLRLEHSLLQTDSLERLRQRFAEEELMNGADRRSYAGGVR